MTYHSDGTSKGIRVFPGGQRPKNNWPGRARICHAAILSFLCLANLANAAPTSDPTPRAAEVLKSAVVRQYAVLLQAEYEDSLRLAVQLQAAIEAFLKKPDPQTMQSARDAWIRCRKPYLQSEVGRFYDGPIDAVEGFINSWPIDENYIDYTVAAPGAGIINQVEKFPKITREVLIGVNEKEGEKNISTGFHAIEFLLWGQDLYADSAGRRPWSDYVDGSSGPGIHAARRRQYLHLLAGLLVEDLRVVVTQWAPDQPHNYRARLLAMPADEALTLLLNGLGNLSSAELSGERLLVPYTTKSQENEHSCFSDTTHLDLIHNELGVQDIWLGRYERENGTVIEGPGLNTLVSAVDPSLAATLRAQIAAALAALKAIPAPFDQAILGDDTMPGRVAIKKSLDALEAQNSSISRAATLLNICLNLK
jgi:putative iron-regulated protein